MDRNSWPVLSSPTPNHFNVQSSMSYHPSKRQREQEDLPAYNEDLVREKKKHRPLPLRSPRRHNKRLSLVEKYPHSSLLALTPVESSDDEVGFTKQFPCGPTAMRPQQLPQGSNTPGLDSDVPMDIDAATTGFDTCVQQLPSTPRNLTYDHPNASRFATNSILSQQSTFPAISSDPGPEISRDTLWCSPRLPSPVSDNGDSMTTNKDTSGDTDMVYEPSPPEHYPPLNSSAMEAEAADMRKRLSSLDLPDQGNAEQISNTSLSKKLGFSMGYRADCDKCRRRVPGHYSHINR
ncbi:hypothetical protein BDV12DRAFT_173629 [Aspergillus spectabilis]